jgi:hypothetical protein
VKIKVTERVKNKFNKDTVGAAGAGGGVAVLMGYSAKIDVLAGHLYATLGLTGEPLTAATDITTDVIVIVGSALISYIASKFMKK